MQRGGKNRCLPICRERPHPRVELLWARGRQAGLLLAWGSERGGRGPPIQEHATLLLLHCLGRGQHQRQQVGASGRLLKTGFAIPVHFCYCYLLQHSSPKDSFALPREDQAVSILGGEEDRD